MSENLRKAALVGLMTQYEVCPFLEESQILAELKVKFSKSNPDGGYFDDPNHYWDRIAELDNVLRYMHQQWVEDNVECFDEYWLEGEGHRFLSWNIVGRTLLCEDGCEYLNDVMEIVSEVESDYKYDIDEIWISLEDHLCENDAHYYAVENVFEGCDEGDQWLITEAADGDPYEGFSMLLARKAAECCDVKYARLAKRIGCLATEIANELKERETFDEGCGSSWHRVFGE